VIKSFGRGGSFLTLPDGLPTVAYHAFQSGAIRDASSSQSLPLAGVIIPNSISIEMVDESSNLEASFNSKVFFDILKEGPAVTHLYRNPTDHLFYIKL